MKWFLLCVLFAWLLMTVTASRRGRGMFVHRSSSHSREETSFFRDNIEDDDSVTLVKADLLIPGAGSPVNESALAFFNVNGTIAYAGQAQLMPTTLNITSSYSFPVVMPGLWDVHTHYGGSLVCENGYAAADQSSLYNDLASGYAPHTLRDFGCAIAMLRETICAGITSVRELGGAYGQALKELERSSLSLFQPMPHFYTAQHAVGMTGGHTDEQYLPIDVTRSDYSSEWMGFGALCDGVGECMKKIREQLRAQADVIKIMTTGGVLSAFDQPTDSEFSLQEAKAMVQEARRAGRIVSAHAHGAEGIKVALDAGVHTLEHGSYLNESLAEQAAQQGVIMVPTITITQTFNRTTRPPQYDPLQWAKGQEVVKHNTAAVQLALSKGVTIATGTDCPGDCAQVGQELLYLNQLFGMSPLQAIQCATANGPLTLGKGRAPLSGQLMIGYAADFIVLTRSPLTSDTLPDLANTDRITHVFKQGRLIKSPDNGVCTNVVTNPRRLDWLPLTL